MDVRSGKSYRPLIFGLLAHSHNNLGNPPDAVIDGLLAESSRNFLPPREGLDLLSIADSSCWRRPVTVETPWNHGYPMHSVRDEQKQPMYSEAFVAGGWVPGRITRGRLDRRLVGAAGAAGRDAARDCPRTMETARNRRFRGHIAVSSAFLPRRSTEEPT